MIRIANEFPVDILTVIELCKLIAAWSISAYSGSAQPDDSTFNLVANAGNKG